MIPTLIRKELIVQARSSEQEVRSFLKDMREAIRMNKFTFIRRRKNLETISQLGLKMCDVIDVLNEPTFENYVKGPKNDYDKTELDKLWVFKERVNGELIYIKVKVEYLKNGGLKVLSFRIDEVW